MVNPLASAIPSTPLSQQSIFKSGDAALFGFTPAKVNLFLELHGKRPDGYHNIETLMASIDLYDTLEVRRFADDRIRLVCEPGTIPNDSRNLVWKAAEALRAAANVNYGVDMKLTKRIPHEAGLGGGSSDAALTLLMLNQLWHLDFSREQLNRVAASVGSDVGFFLNPHAAWCTGRGEIIEDVSFPFPLSLVLVKPPVGLSTAAVYGHVTPNHEVKSSTKMRHATTEQEVVSELFNRLEAPAFAASPLVENYYQKLQSCEPIAVLLSGSGSCLFAVAADRADAEDIAHAFTKKAPECRTMIVRCPAPDARSLDSLSSRHGVSL